MSKEQDLIERLSVKMSEKKQMEDTKKNEICKTKENPCNETKSEKMARLEERLYENTIVKKDRKVPSTEELDKLQDAFENDLVGKKEDLLKRKNRILHRLAVEKDLLDGNETYPVKVEKEPGKIPYQEKEYEMVNHPQHYNNYDVEVVDMMERIWGTKATMEWCKMTAYKYRMRMGTKPGKDETKEAMKAKLMEDFEKEQWYLDKAKELKDKLFDQSIDMNQ